MWARKVGLRNVGFCLWGWVVRLRCPAAVRRDASACLTPPHVRGRQCSRWIVCTSSLVAYGLLRVGDGAADEGLFRARVGAIATHTRYRRDINATRHGTACERDIATGRCSASAERDRKRPPWVRRRRAWLCEEIRRARAAAPWTARARALRRGAGTRPSCGRGPAGGNGSNFHIAAARPQAVRAMEAPASSAPRAGSDVAASPRAVLRARRQGGAREAPKARLTRVERLYARSAAREHPSDRAAETNRATHPATQSPRPQDRLATAQMQCGHRRPGDSHPSSARAADTRGRDHAHVSVADTVSLSVDDRAV